MRLSLTVTLLGIAIAVGCDDLPTELAGDVPLHATELGLRANVAPYSRAALFEEAVRQVGRGVAALA